MTSRLGTRGFALVAVALAPLSCGEVFKAGDGSGGKSGSAATAGKSGDGAAPSAGGSGDDAGAGPSDAGQPSGGTAGGSLPSAGASGSAGGDTAGGSAGSGGSAGGGGSEPAIPKLGLELWLRADQGVETVGAGVSIWRDGSGHGRDATQIAGSYRPKLVGDAFSGKPALVFDGDDDFLKLAPLTVDFAAGVSIFVALEQSTLESCQSYFEASNGSETDDLHFGAYRNALLFEVAAPYVNDISYPLLVDAPQVAVGILDEDALVHMRSNGDGAGEGAAGIPIATTREQVFIGRTLYEGCELLQANVGEILLYSRALSDAELLQVEGYLQDKWGCCQP